LRISVLGTLVVDAVRVPLLCVLSVEETLRLGGQCKQHPMHSDEEGGAVAKRTWKQVRAWGPFGTPGVR
jgi:hypothetical protein